METGLLFIVDLFFAGDDLKKRWKNLRDCFSKYLRSEKTRTGQAAKGVSRYKTWPWAHYMEMFRPFLQFAQTYTNVPDAIAETPELTNEETETTETSDSRQSEAKNDEERSSTTGSDRKQAKKRKLIEDPPSNSSSVEKVIQFLNKKHNEVNNHPIDLAFQAYAASVKKLSPHRQTLIKYKVAKILMEEELQQLAETQEENRPMTSSSFNSISPPHGSNMTSNSIHNTHQYRNIDEAADNSSSSAAWYEDFSRNII